jgi:hypothetical protein
VLRKTANAAHNTADNAAKVFITNAKKRLSKFFGEAYTTEWGAAGLAEQLHRNAEHPGGAFQPDQQPETPLHCHPSP